MAEGEAVRERPVQELVLAGRSGVWSVRAADGSAFFVDADPGAVGRASLPDGTPSVFDSTWLLIHAIVGPSDRGVIRVGDAHRYFLTPPDDSVDGGCWFQPVVEVIEPAADAELAGLPPRLPTSAALVHRSDPRNPLVLAKASGVWAVRSTSPTVYYLDADRLLLLRRRGTGSSEGPGDDRWVPLVALESAVGREAGVIRVGDRHKYTFDYAVDGPEYGWWVQRAVTAVEPVGVDELAGLPARPGEMR